jgi:hypothetical protein
MAHRLPTGSEVPALFPAWSDTAFRVVLIGIALGVPAVFVVPMLYVRSPYNLNRNFPVDQPVQFDHRHHVQDDGIECLYCHHLAERTPHAGVPPTELCMGCHSQIWNQSVMLEPVRRSWFSGLPIPWNRVHNLPDFVYFNHAIHVNRGVTCQECHGDVASMPLVQQTELLTMGWCLDCHRQREALLGREIRVGRRRAITDKPVLEQPPRLTNCTICHR